MGEIIYWQEVGMTSINPSRDGIVLGRRVFCKDERVESREFGMLSKEDESLDYFRLKLKDGDTYTVMIEGRPDEEVFTQAEQYLKELPETKSI